MAADDSVPFTPSKLYPKSDEEIATFKAMKKERSGKCFVYVFAGIVIQCVFILVFALVTLRSRIPDAKISSIMVKNLGYNNATSSASISPSFNATLVAEVTIKNTNFGRFKFENTTMSVLYGGIQNVGDTKIGHGSVKARDTQKMINLTVEVRSSRVFNHSQNLSSEIQSGMLKLSSYAKFRGSVNLLNIVKRKEIAQMNCTMILNFTSGKFQDLRCQ
ncbi:late embryogenesis abundant protein At1g64065-like [Juglans microcarpa x Juglans regia]|uniref:late embryogenesis abundant protein At1g64065-like n=1 Tax=Juglans microcarpa x Juglans regia TaxID=2249226 RepID=UPI001B7EF33F|nr:late embryogenesis abundant protein At1g64065-like [Juglans microcarpa x Juglans regia]